MKKIRDIFSGNEGFTLIELLIVIVIIGVLAAIAVPNLIGLEDSANVEVVRANARTLLTELEAHLINNSDLTGFNSEAWNELDSMNTDGDISITTPNSVSNGVSDIYQAASSDKYKLVIEVDNSEGNTVTITIDDGSLTTSGA